MSKSVKLRIEEYLPAGSFLETSFSRDRAEFEQTFSEFTSAYLEAFRNQLEVIEALEDRLVLTQEQKEVTQSLYLAKDEMNKQLNILSLHFKKSKLDTKIITAAKKDLRSANVEGANLKLKSIIQVIDSKTAILESKGMASGYSEALAIKSKALLDKNIMQNKLMNDRGLLTEKNAGEYKALYQYITNITESGRILYDGTAKRDEYVITKLIARMRSAGN